MYSDGDMILTIAMAVTLAFIIGYLFTMIPMSKTMPLKQAAKMTVIGDTASIAAMETIENSLAFAIPGFMHTLPRGIVLLRFRDHFASGIRKQHIMPAAGHSR
ncbi:MAG TPA: DUF4396 domain-containing protein [Nitrososphaeraceae archaeon]|jgi:hypothetical protein|nr:DUF4396 domain-containing protein [Nitrososphaeraceae archaeon]